MARVTATRTRQVIVVEGVGPTEGYTPEQMEFINPDGTPFDFSEIDVGLPEIPDVPAFQGEWAVDTPYAAQNIVRHLDALYIASFGAAPNVEPGTAVDDTAASPGGSAYAGTYNRLAPGVTPAVPYVDGHALVFFDLSAGGNISIDYDIGAGNQFGELYDDTGTSVGTAGGLGSPLEIFTSITGRYFADIQNAFGGDGSGDMTFTLSSGAEVTGDVQPWVFMLQGVAP